MFVNVIDVSQEVSKMTKTNKPYTEIEVTFKSADNKVSNKKLNNLGFDKKVYTTFVSAKKGDTFEVTSVKEGDYWVWKDVVPTSAQGTQTASGGGTKAGSGAGAERSSSYETKEERASRQVLIVKQSSLSNAVASLKTDKGGVVDPNKAIEVAQLYTDWVMGVDTSIGLSKDPLEQEFDDVPN
jgi:hypothetical protein